MLEESEARRRFPNLARVLFDVTNGNDLNTATHVRDQERAPVDSDAADSVSLGTHVWSHGGRQRGAQTGPNPQGRLAHAGLPPEVGVSAACSYCNWVASSIGNVTQYLTGRYATSWLMLRSDDFHLEVGDVHFRPALLISFLLCSVVGCPLSWKKPSGGYDDLMGRIRALAISTRFGRQ